MTDINCFAPSFSSSEYEKAYRWIEEQKGDDLEGTHPDYYGTATETGGRRNARPDFIGRYDRQEEVWEDFEDELIARLDAERASGNGPTTWADREAELVEASDTYSFGSAPMSSASDEDPSDDEDHGPLTESVRQPQVSELIKEMRTPYVFERLGVDYWWSTVQQRWVEYHVGTGTHIRPSAHQQRSWKNAKTRTSQHVKPHLSKQDKKQTAAKFEAAARLIGLDALRKDLASS